jgi:hypothetical protein
MDKPNANGLKCRGCQIGLSVADVWKVRLALRDALDAVGKEIKRVKWLDEAEPLCWGCAVARPEWPSA